MKAFGSWLLGDKLHDARHNLATIARPSREPSARHSLRDLFVLAYDQIAGRCRDVESAGLAVIAVDEHRPRTPGLLQVAAGVDRHAAAIIGRHDACDLYLATNARMALRHVAIILDPVTSWRPNELAIRFRLLDLRTRDGFVDEAGRTLRGIRCEGPAIVRCGGHALFALPLGDPTDWPQSAEDAWACLPERVYFDEIDRFPDGTRPQPRLGADDLTASNLVDVRRSLITRTHGPRDSSVQIVGDGPAAGMLELIGPSARETISIGSDALADGVLLGRYARCDGAGHLAGDTSLSRVHALLIQVDDTILVIDTASSNGTWQQGARPPHRVLVLDDDTELMLGKTTRARWRWTS